MFIINMQIIKSNLGTISILTDLINLVYGSANKYGLLTKTIQ